LWLKKEKLPARALASVHSESQKNLIGSFALRARRWTQSDNPSVGPPLAKQEACQLDAAGHFRNGINDSAGSAGYRRSMPEAKKPAVGYCNAQTLCTAP
jgi:hypothetical protein